MKIKTLWSLLVIVAILLPFAMASSGDENPEFQGCFGQCIVYFKGHVTIPGRSFYHPNAAFVKLFFWNIEDECKYQCMHILESKSIVPQKYFGKWPFRRVLGMQELFSALFSFGTLLGHILGYHSFKMAMMNDGENTPMLYSIYAHLNALTWLASTVFHIRDTPYTEFFDYFLGLASVMYMAYIAIVRVVIPSNKALQCCIGILMAAYCIWHYYQMEFNVFDYGWNLKVNGGISVLHAMIWAYWLSINRHLVFKFGKKLLLFFGFAAWGFLIGVIDFPPLFQLVDSHAIWHLCLMLSYPAYWSFLKDEWLEALKTSLVETKFFSREEYI